MVAVAGWGFCHCAAHTFGIGHVAASGLEHVGKDEDGLVEGLGQRLSCEVQAMGGVANSQCANTPV